MPGIPQKCKEAQSIAVLVVSHNPRLADVRKHVLEEAGFKVIPASDPDTVRTSCEANKIGLVLIGYSLSPAEKRRVWYAARQACKTPILELYESGKPELVDSHALYSHQSHTPEDFLEAVHHILSNA